MKSIGLFLLLVLSSFVSQDLATTRPADRLSFRLVAQDPGVDRNLVEELPDPADRSRNLLVFREVLLNATDVASAKVTRQPEGQYVVMLTMTGRGAETLKRVTAANIDRQMALVLDGKVLIAPVIRSEISRQVAIDLGQGSDAAECLAIANQIEQAIAAANQPTTRPD